MKNLLKSFVNSIKIPGLLSFFILRDGTKNPTLSESLKNAQSQDTWTRLGLGNLAFGNFPMWALFSFLFFIVAISQVELPVRGLAFIAMLIVLYFLIRSWGEKK